MADKKYKITATYEYEGVVEGTNEGNAEHNFLKELNSHYQGTESFEIVEVCFSCEEELNEGKCYECEEEE